MVMGVPSFVVMFMRRTFLVCRAWDGLRSGEVKEEEDYDNRKHGPLESDLNYPQRLHKTSPLCLLSSADMKTEGLR